jgi:Leucine-rich repeat (LRR) protein
VTLKLSHNKLTKLPLIGVGTGGQGDSGGSSGSNRRSQTPKEKRKSKKKSKKGGKGGGEGQGQPGFESLTYLDVSFNEIASLESALPPALVHLNLSHNLIQDIEDKQLQLCKR